MANCHPTHAQRTKCACGKVLSLSRAVGSRVIQCECGRTHSKVEGSAFAPYHTVIDGRLSTGKRKGGPAGCPGTPI